MRTIHVMCGLPASGKSTYCEEHGKNDIIIHRDVVRQHLRELVNSTEYFPTNADVEYMFLMNYVRAAYWGSNKDIWIDQTTLSNGAAVKLITRLAEIINFENVSIHFHIMKTPFETCMERNNKREGFARVSDKTMKSMAMDFRINPREVITVKLPNIKFGSVWESFHGGDGLDYWEMQTEEDET